MEGSRTGYIRAWFSPVPVLYLPTGSQGSVQDGKDRKGLANVIHRIGITCWGVRGILENHDNEDTSEEEGASFSELV